MGQNIVKFLNEFTRIKIDFNLIATATPERKVTIALSLTNNSPQDYLVSKGVLLIDGPETGAPFHITGPSQILCLISQHNSHSKPNLFVLEAYTTMRNSVTISDYCFFEDALPGIYTISFNTYFDVYNTNNYHLYYERDTSAGIDSCFQIENSSFLIGEVRHATLLVESQSHEL